jgi:dynein intermediate chain 1
VSLSIIYDFYMANEKTIEGEANKDEEENIAKSKKPVSNEPINKEAQIDKKLLTAAKVLERMVNINTYDDIAKDYRFYEEPADEATYPEGSLMPLWKFKVFKDRKDVEVTGLQWSPKYPDMFGVSYGSFDFYQKYEESYLCLFSLKNPSYPEYICKTHCGIMCLDIHQKYPHMVVVGLYDGNIAVFNFASKSEDPMYVSNAKNGKHTDPVWQIKWAKDNLDGYLNFYSISGDGRVTNWTIVKTSLWFKDEFKVFITKTLSNTKDISGTLFDGARSIAFQPYKDSQFLIGTEEGYEVLPHLCL